MSVDKDSMRTRLRRFIELLPRTKAFNFLAEAYVDHYNNFNNTDMHRNGEFRSVVQALSGVRNPIVLDVGANIGDWTLAVYARFPEANLYCFEPTLEAYQQLVKRLPANIKTFRLGVGSEPGELQMYVYSGESAHNSLFPRHDKPHSGLETAEVITLDHFCDQHAIDHIDYLKIDTEGNDYHVLLGSRELLSRGKIRAIQFEYSNNYIDARVLLKDIFDFVQSLNYRIFKIMPHGLAPLSEYRSSYERFAYSNYCILRPDVMDQVV